MGKPVRMVPPDLVQAVGVTSSERRVHAALSRSTIRGVALHSLNLPEHERKLTAELDFVLITDQLVLCVEVKGARVTCRDGTWTYSDSHGHVRTSTEGPFAQVRSAMYALRARLERLLGHSETDKLAFGFLVITTDVDLPPATEWAPETYVGCRRFNQAGGLEDAIGRAASYWRRKQRWAQNISSALRGKILNTLRPEFDKVPGLMSRAASLDAAFDQLSNEQLSHLDIVSDNARVICQGGAGTAKTFIAVEVARRAAARGNHVLLVCRSTVLAAYLRGRLATVRVDVAAISEVDETSTYDHVVVDEGQDLLTFDALAKLDGVLCGGWESGHWTFFLDPNKQALYGPYEPEVFDLMRSCAVTATLRNNCRNTKEIVFNTRLFTGADVGVAAAGSGPKVEIVDVADSDDEAKKLDAWLRKLADDDVALSDITVVSLGAKWENSAASRTKAGRTGRIEQLTATRVATWPPSRISWASVVDIKGLENRFVAVVDVDGLEDTADVDRLYVGMSRPRAGLWLAIPESAREALGRLWKTNVDQASEVLERRTR